MRKRYNYLLDDDDNVIRLTRNQLEIICEHVFCIYGDGQMWSFKEKRGRRDYVFINPYTSEELIFVLGSVYIKGIYTLVTYGPHREEYQYKILVAGFPYFHFPQGTTYLNEEQTWNTVCLEDLIEVVFENTPWLITSSDAWVYESHSTAVNEVTLVKCEKFVEGKDVERFTFSVENATIYEFSNLRLKLNDGTFLDMKLLGVGPYVFDQEEDVNGDWRELPESGCGIPQEEM